MKKYTVVLLTSLISYGIGAQDPTPKFESLKLNSSPAFILLGVEPENLQRPSSPKQFIAGVQNAIVNEKLKPNVAIEATPYYWKNPDEAPERFKYEKFLIGNKNVFKNIAETFTFSLGTSESDTVVFGNLDPGTALGAGIRFTIIDGKPSRPNLDRLVRWNKLQYRLDILQSILNKMETADEGVLKESLISETINEAAGRVKKEGLYHVATETDITETTLAIRMDLINSMTLGDSAFKARLTQLFDETDAQEELLLAQLNKEKVPFAKNGFILEFAGGSAFVFQNNEWDGFKYAKAGIWLTPSYRWQLKDDDGQDISLFDLIGVLRLTFNNTSAEVDIANYFDAGLKIQYTHNRISLAAEGVYRHASKVPAGISKKYTYRFITSLDYKLTDVITFKFSFGSNFDGNTVTYSDPKKMFAVGGVSFGLFNIKGN